jgi:hypothetical protein
MRYVAEATWLPTYLAVVVLVLGVVENPALAAIALLLSLVLFRMVLELVYRLAFEDARLKLSTQLGAVGAQVVAWGLVWIWHVQRSTAP